MRCSPSTWGQANVSILWWLGVTIIGGWVLARTAFGNWIFATGGNPVAARGAGVPTRLVKIVLFVATGLGASLVGIIQAIEYHTGNATAGLGYVFQAPIVAVIGGVLLGGGYGSALRRVPRHGHLRRHQYRHLLHRLEHRLGAALSRRPPYAAVATNHYFRRLAMSTA